MPPNTKRTTFTFVPDSASASVQQSHQPETRRGKSGNRAKALTIVHYDPSGEKKRGIRDRDGTKPAAAGEGNAEKGQTNSGEFGAVKQGPAPPARIERIPSSRSWDPFNALAVLYVSKEERFMLNYGTLEKTFEKTLYPSCDL